MAVQIQLRRDTAINWTTNNPTPADGELCIEKDTIKIKFGDGVTDWVNLDYFESGGDLLSQEIETFVVDSTIKSNGYLPLVRNIEKEEPHLINLNGLILFEGLNEDFTIDATGNRIVFTGSQTGDLVIGDKIQVTYMYK